MSLKFLFFVGCYNLTCLDLDNFPNTLVSQVKRKRNEYFNKGKGKKAEALSKGKIRVDDYSEGSSGSSFPVRYKDLKKEK